LSNRPNIVWINTHDVSAAHLGCYGDRYSTTPNLDRLASEGIRYQNAFASGPICSPARTSIFTGMHQTTVGTHHHRSFAIRPDFIRLLPEYLHDAGYVSTEINTDLNTPIDPHEWSRYLTVDSILESDSSLPFFALFSYKETHASTFKMSPEEVRRERSNLLTEEQLHDPGAAPLPSLVPSTPLSRERMALFYDTLTQVDCHVGEVIGRLRSKRLLENTIVFFWSDHGTGTPRGKTHAYDDGLRVPLIIRFPEKYRHLSPGPAGTVVEDITMTMDMGASVLSMIDVPIPDHFQGRAFLGDQQQDPRTYAYGARDRLDNCNEMIRTIRDGRYRYIRNFLPHRPYASFYPDGGFFSPAPKEGSPEHDLWDTSCLPGKEKLHDPDGVFLLPIPQSHSQELIWGKSKPHEELYHVTEDPEEIHNLACDPASAEKCRELREALYAWMTETRDLGLIDEPEMIVRAQEFDGVNFEVGAACGNFERILETADCARLGSAGKEMLHERLKDKDSAVRYWAVTGLMSYELDIDVTSAIEQLVNDESMSVALAAADLLCRADRVGEALPGFDRGLKSDLLWTRCRAGANLSYYSPDVLLQMTSLLPALRSALANPSCYGSYDPDVTSLIPPVRSIYVAQRETIAGNWVLSRVINRIELAAAVRM
jgi:N-sulfoglucosamine sulfohydrolase